MALQSIIIRNSIEPCKTGNCTNFDDDLCESEGLLDFSWKRKQKHTETFTNDPHTLIAETVLTQNDLDRPNVLWDNVMYYVSGFLVKSLLARVQCVTCRDELLLDPRDCHAYKMYNMYPVYAKFTAFKQQDRLVFPSASVLKIVKATEVIFRRRVIEQGFGISTDINLFGRIQSLGAV